MTNCRHLLLAAALCAPAALAQTTTPPSDTDLLIGHYQRVEQELLAKDTSALNEAQRTARVRALALLRAYRERADFGVMRETDEGRKPYFVDDGERRCAVAWILDGLGAGDVTKRVWRDANHAWIVDLAGDAELEGWLAQLGLTLEEAARIQAPSNRFSPPPPPPRPAPAPKDYAGPGEAARPPMRTRGPRVTRPDDAAIERPSNGGAAATGAARGARGARTTARSGSGPLRNRTLAFELETLDWNAWWNVHRARLLHAPAAPAPVPVPGASRVSDAAERARAELLPAVLRQLDDADARVRQAAALALGRIGGDAAVAPLTARLEDPSLEVRDAAILGLGACGTPRAVHALAHLARSGRRAGTGALVSPDAHELAVVALGLARAHDQSVTLAALVDGMLRGDFPAGRGDARLLATRLNGAAGASVDEVSDAAALELRCRSVENLGFVADRAATARLTRALSGRDLELRRAAAVALGQSHDALALPALQTAFELERETLTRAFVLLAIGERPEAEARDFLLHVLAAGDKPLRPWAALAAGSQARRTGDRLLAPAIRAALGNENNQDAHGAYLLAAGLARDPTMVGRIAQTLRGDQSDRRIVAAEALGLLGGDAAVRVLRARLANEPCVFVAAALCEALAAAGEPVDAGFLLGLLARVHDDDPRERAAFALSRLQTDAGHVTLVAVLNDPAAPATVRAAALEALSRKLDARGPRLAPLAGQLNWAVLPEWLRTVLGSTL